MRLNRASRSIGRPARVNARPSSAPCQRCTQLFLVHDQLIHSSYYLFSIQFAQWWRNCLGGIAIGNSLHCSIVLDDPEFPSRESREVRSWICRNIPVQGYYDLNESTWSKRCSSRHVATPFPTCYTLLDPLVRVITERRYKPILRRPFNPHSIPAQIGRAIIPTFRSSRVG